MKDRIKEVRTSLNLTQQEFADRIGTPRANIAGYERGIRTPSEAMISLICREFRINEAWLRSGLGDMKADMEIHEELTLMFADVLSTAPDKRSALIAAILSQPPEFWDLIADLAEEAAARIKALPETEKED